MSSQRTPLRSRSSLGTYNSGVSTPSKQPTKPRVNISDLRRPPSRSFRPSSPQVVPGSRSGSSLGSRPGTPSFIKNQEPYTGTISVSIRPNPHSVNSSQPSAWEVDHFSNTITNTSDYTSFTFDNVFSPDTALTNREVYTRSCSNIISQFLNQGYNGTVFAYGMTGSGKTFSMKGEVGDPGFVELAVEDIYRKIDMDSLAKEYTISINYLEIYNEKIIDLLSASSTATMDLKIRDDPIHGTKIVGITTPVISSKEQLLSLIKKGDINRKTSATDFNARSSRSHSILQIRLATIDLNNRTEQHSTLSLCDLAGSERATSSVERRKEGAFINKSLLALSTVINKLSSASSGNGPTGADHIPYRDSKLTRLLQPALSGSSLVSILCTIHLGSGVSQTSCVSETYNTLRFAARAKDIIMNVERNSTSSFSGADSMLLIEELRKTIESQKNEISILKLNGNIAGSGHGSISGNESMKVAQLEADNRVLKEKIEHLTRLTDLQKTETVILKNDALNDILAGGGSSHTMMANLEDFHKRVNYEMEEYKSYIYHLENQVRLAHQQNIVDNKPSSSSAMEGITTDADLEAVLKDQEDEILQLKELLKDKDHIIQTLTKTSKVRRLGMSNSANSMQHSNPSGKPIVSGFRNDNPSSPTRGNKENEPYLKDFNISPKKPKESIDISETAGIKFVI
ncbi:hypothetical protein G9P44_002349 [Scheffersomyces stipitis]|nr:hypothetical protein G9P44_002349 [Scheffersomyces stipitis]